MSRLEKQQDFYTHQIHLNALFVKHIMFGVGLFNGGAVTTNIGYRHNYFNVSLGYEFLTNDLGSNASGSTELTAAFTLRNKADRKIVKDFERW